MLGLMFADLMAPPPRLFDIDVTFRSSLLASVTKPKVTCLIGGGRRCHGSLRNCCTEQNPNQLSHHVMSSAVDSCRTCCGACWDMHADRSRDGAQ